MGARPDHRVRGARAGDARRKAGVAIEPAPKVTVDGGDLDLGSGLLLLLERALDDLEPGDWLVLTAGTPSVAQDLPAWCRTAGHHYQEALPASAARHLIQRGTARRLHVTAAPDWGLRMPLRDGKEADTRDWRVGERAAALPERADPRTGFSPRGSVVETGAPTYRFTLTEQARVWAEEAAELYEQATAHTWDASRDIPWALLASAPLPDELERAVCQIMTFLTENELAALYVPAKFLPRIHPHFIEVPLFLATQIADEARHVEAFTKRALAGGGGLQYSTASTQLSLKTLHDQEDLSAATFLLSVLGEGTFLDLLRFIETYAPDPVTRELVRRARADETRHVRFGMGHIRYFLASTPDGAELLLAAARQRAGILEQARPPAPAQEALALLAAGGSLAPSAVRRGVAAVRALWETMHENRIKRLLACGLQAAQAEEMSGLHTPNFM